MPAVVLEDVAELDRRPVEIALLDQAQGILVMLLGAFFGGLACGEGERQSEGETDAEKKGTEHWKLSDEINLNRLVF
jgi:hypothetical protein